MEITSQFVQIPQNKTADDLVSKKLENLANHYDWIIRAKVIFKEDKSDNGKGKICEVMLSLPGPQIFASSNQESHEVAVAETIKDLEIQLKKRKSEMKSH